MSHELSNKTSYALPPGAGKAMGWLGSTITLKASCPEIGITEATLRPGEEPPLHLHKNEDEWLMVLDGKMTFHVGCEDHLGKTGAFVSFPRGIPHTFTVESEKARFLVMNTPGGFEHMFELAPKTPEEAVWAMTAFGMEVIGPHPREAAAIERERSLTGKSR